MDRIQFINKCAHQTTNLRAQLTTPVIIRFKTDDLCLQLSYHNYLRRPITNPLTTTTCKNYYTQQCYQPPAGIKHRLTRSQKVMAVRQLRHASPRISIA